MTATSHIRFDSEPLIEDSECPLSASVDIIEIKRRKLSHPESLLSQKQKWLVHLENVEETHHAQSVNQDESIADQQQQCIGNDSCGACSCFGLKTDHIDELGVNMIERLQNVFENGACSDIRAMCADIIANADRSEIIFLLALLMDGYNYRQRQQKRAYFNLGWNGIKRSLDWNKFSLPLLTSVNIPTRIKNAINQKHIQLNAMHNTPKESTKLQYYKHPSHIHTKSSNDVVSSGKKNWMIWKIQKGKLKIKRTEVDIQSEIGVQQRRLSKLRTELKKIRLEACGDPETSKMNLINIIKEWPSDPHELFNIEHLNDEALNAFKALFQKKGVTVIGNGPVKNKMGTEIDNSSDIIIRCNEFTKDSVSVGTRIDLQIMHAGSLSFVKRVAKNMKLCIFF